MRSLSLSLQTLRVQEDLLAFLDPPPKVLDLPDGFAWGLGGLGGSNPGLVALISDFLSDAVFLLRWL